MGDDDELTCQLWVRLREGCTSLGLTSSSELRQGGVHTRRSHCLHVGLDELLIVIPVPTVAQVQLIFVLKKKFSREAYSACYRAIVFTLDVLPTSRFSVGKEIDV